MPLRNICFVVYPGFQSIDVTGPYEVFAGANRYLASAGKKPVYALTVAAVHGRTVTTDSGMRIQPDKALRQVKGPLDTIVVPGGFAFTEAEKHAALLKQVSRLVPRSRRV